MKGALSTCAILDNWRLKCFGNNLFGQLGQGAGVPLYYYYHYYYYGPHALTD